MLSGISPLLIGSLLWHLDSMGHSDAVVIADAHFPSARLASRLIELPGTSATDVVTAIRSVLPLDPAGPLDLMASADGRTLPIHDELIAASELDGGQPRFLDRADFYTGAAEAFVIVHTGETRTFANAVLRKGIVL